MYCKYCGNKLDEQSTFCSKCGKRVSFETQNFESEVNVTTQQDFDPALEAQKQELGEQVLKKGVAGLVWSAISLVNLCFMGLAAISVWFALIYFAVEIALAIVGVVLSVQAKSLANEYEYRFGKTEGKATVGKSLSIPGKIIAIVALAFVAYFAIVVAVLAEPTFY